MLLASVTLRAHIFYPWLLPGLLNVLLSSYHPVRQIQSVGGCRTWHMDSQECPKDLKHRFNWLRHSRDERRFLIQMRLRALSLAQAP